MTLWRDLELPPRGPVQRSRWTQVLCPSPLNSHLLMPSSHSHTPSLPWQIRGCTEILVAKLLFSTQVSRGILFFPKIAQSYQHIWGFPGGPVVKNPPANSGDAVLIPESGGSPEKEMATHSSILVWRIPWTEEPGGLQSMESQGVGHILATKQQKQGQSI